MEHAAFTMGGASGRLSPAHLAQEQDVGAAMEASRCWWASPAQSLSQEDSPYWVCGAVCGLWRVGEGPKVPQTISPWLHQQL